MLSDPFNFKMKVLEKGEEKEVNLNLIETFNLWYGIEVKRYVSKEYQGKKYIFVLGRKHQQDLIILWRNTKGLDYIKDKEFTMNVLQNEFKINDNTTEIKQVFVNNDSILDLSSYGIQVQSLNSIFFKLQWGEY
jgi:adenine-specific DNA-methyltransferase